MKKINAAIPEVALSSAGVAFENTDVFEKPLAALCGFTLLCGLSFTDTNHGC